MQSYLDLLKDVLENGAPKDDRTKTGTLSVFGRQIRINLQDGFPLLTTKKLHFKAIVHELLWFLSGDTNIKYLQENKVKIWDAWADEHGNLGPVYGHQWRKFGYNRRYSWEGIDQIERLIKSIKSNPNSRRHIVSAWNPVDVDQMALPPCHVLSQFYINEGKISCQLYQRSADLFLGVPFNIASYALLLMMVAQICDLEPYEFIHTFGDAHIYNNHLEQVKKQLNRKPKELPKITLNPKVKDIFNFQFDDFTMKGYDPHPRIKAKVAVGQLGPERS